MWLVNIFISAVCLHNLIFSRKVKYWVCSLRLPLSKSYKTQWVLQIRNQALSCFRIWHQLAVGDVQINAGCAHASTSARWVVTKDCQTVSKIKQKLFPWNLTNMDTFFFFWIRFQVLKRWRLRRRLREWTQTLRESCAHIAVTAKIKNFNYCQQRNLLAISTDDISISFVWLFIIPSGALYILIFRSYIGV